MVCASLDGGLANSVSSGCLPGGEEFGWAVGGGETGGGDSAAADRDEGERLVGERGPVFL
ncbi:hypothetical protein FsymDg_2514 [Candidatus Protofrankia datiscae]|uniref:Uncharacterized protein n=1 Tax=Candidatus Protofrankia datiscae TaxID=2716812 RepID=F8B286_9ACTN|nr:hypothetical protein FsymDg_2514 [Candidatus Protofrankia datiscae]